MATFSYGFINGTGDDLEYQLWNEQEVRCGGLDTKSIDDLLGPRKLKVVDFRKAPYHCAMKTGNSGFVICGFNKDKIEKLADIFTKYLHEFNSGFLSVPVVVHESLYSQST